MALILDHPARKARLVLDVAYPLHGGPGRVRVRYVAGEKEWAAEQEVTDTEARRWITALLGFIKDDAK